MEFRALAASWVFYNRIEQIQGFFICYTFVNTAFLQFTLINFKEFKMLLPDL